jgi:predicted metal-binding membrane protein
MASSLISTCRKVASCTDTVNGTALEGILRRDRIVVAIALTIVALLAWAYLLHLGAQLGMTPGDTSEEMSGMDMPGMDMSGMNIGDAIAPNLRAWALPDFAFIFTMWAVMMVGMMTPSVAPMVLLYALVGRKARTGGKPFASTGWFFAGYVLVWILFSILATICQWLLASMALLNPMMATGSSTVGGLVLIFAGLYQWTPLKEACLRQCQVPIAFLSSHGGFRSDPFGALRLGIDHGTYCLGCCWALMALLFVGGVMNIAWIGGIAFLILLEKTVPAGRLVPRISGIILVAAGIWLLMRT